MTPLAQRYANGKVSHDHGSQPVDMEEMHCFELSAVTGAVADVGMCYADAGIPDPLVCFLPAPMSWLEWHSTSGKQRYAFILSADDDSYAHWYLATEHGIKHLGRIGLRKRIEQCANGSVVSFVDRADDIPLDFIQKMTVLVYGMLALINTPQYIARKQHAPHAGLARKMARAKGELGKAKLRPWTEIKLDISPTMQGDDAPAGTRLTGEKAYHHVKSYLRVSTGQIIPDHYRGNPALGVVRKWHTVTDSRRADAPAPMAAE